jgi:hypothetical protein
MMVENRWKLFGHVLHLPLDSPAQLSMTQYYVPLKVSKGQPKTSLPVFFNKELHEHSLLKLTTPQDLAWIRAMVDDRKGWQQFTEVTSQAPKSDMMSVGSNMRIRTLPLHLTYLRPFHVTELQKLATIVVHLR